LQVPPKIDKKLDFWFENKPSGNPGSNLPNLCLKPCEKNGFIFAPAFQADMAIRVVGEECHIH
jgi:hypothetical protein